MHKKYGCGDCDKVFDFEVVLEKHIEAVHEHCKLFCHYYNNDKVCPFNEQCIYLHEDSGMCKFGKGCERVLCMFGHEDNDAVNIADEDESDSDEEDEEEYENVYALKPILNKFKEAVEKFDTMLQKCSLKCKHSELPKYLTCTT